MAAGDDGYVVLGVITAAHGIKGDVKLKSFTEVPEDIAAYGPLATASGASLEIEAIRPAKAGLIARLKGVRDRNAAEALRGVELRLDRARLPAPDEDEFYHADLIGLTARTVDGETFGTVVAVHNFGAGDLLEIRQAGESKTELVPFTKAGVPELDVKTGRLVIVPPAGDEDDEQGEG